MPVAVAVPVPVAVPVAVAVVAIGRPPHSMPEFVYYFPDEAVLTDHCYWFGPWYWY